MKNVCTHDHDWSHLIAHALARQGILQERAPGQWRLRWREYDAQGGIRHRSMAVPADKLDQVRGQLEQQKTQRQTERREREAEEARERAHYRRYRQLRRQVWARVPGGRHSKYDAIRIFDALVQRRGVDIANLLFSNGIFDFPRPRGRPSKPQLPQI